MEKIILFFHAIFLLFAPIAYSAMQTNNTVPSANATFFADNATFLRHEDAQRAQRLLTRIVSGGIGATDASLTHTISTVTAYVEGYYVTDTSVSRTGIVSSWPFTMLFLFMDLRLLIKHVNKPWI